MLPGKFWEAPTHADIIEFKNLKTLQLKDQMSGNQLAISVCF